MANVIITGSTGMIGKGVLLECLGSDKIEKVIVINRRPLEMKHPKLKEIILDNFLDVSEVSDQLTGFDGCFYCMGVSALGMIEADYTRITYSMTKAFADTLYNLNKDMVFNYVSGVGTDRTEKGRSMWARVKGRTENYILNKGFRDAYAFRPGVIIPEKGIRSSTGWYNTMYAITRPLFPLLKRAKRVTTTTKLGRAMINSLFQRRENKVLSPRDINEGAGYLIHDL